MTDKEKEGLMARCSKERLIEIIEESDNHRRLYDLAYANAFRAVEEGRLDKELFNEIFEELPAYTEPIQDALKTHFAYIRKKRVFPTLKGQKKAEFKYEFNTMKQIFHIGSWPGWQTYLAEEFAFLWAVWGAYNFAGLFEMKPEEKAKMDDIIK